MKTFNSKLVYIAIMILLVGILSASTLVSAAADFDKAPRDLPPVHLDTPVMSIFPSTPNSNIALLNWSYDSTKNSITGFAIERQENLGQWVEVAKVGQTERHWSQKVPESLGFVYRLYAFNDRGDHSGYSNMETMNPDPIPPTNLKLEWINARTDVWAVKLTWQNNSKFVRGWYIHRINPNGSEQVVKTLYVGSTPAGPVISNIDDTAEYNKTYVYYITAIINKESTPSNKASIWTVFFTPKPSK